MLSTSGHRAARAHGGARLAGQMHNQQAARRDDDLLEMCPGAILAVDLDGTLVHADMLRRGLAQVLRRAPSSAVALALALLRGGRPGLKQAVALRAPFDPAELPYNTAVVALARAWRARARKVVLATAADAGVAQTIAAHLDLFDAVHASSGAGNLKGRAKAAFLTRTYGVRGFVYAGDSSADLHVWAEAAGAVLASDSPALRARLLRMDLPVQILADAHARR